MDRQTEEKVISICTDCIAEGYAPNKLLKQYPKIRFWELYEIMQALDLAGSYISNLSLYKKTDEYIKKGYLTESLIPTTKGAEIIFKICLGLVQEEGLASDETYSNFFTDINNLFESCIKEA